MLTPLVARWVMVADLDNNQISDLHAREKYVDELDKKEHGRHMGYCWHIDGQRLMAEMLAGQKWGKNTTPLDRERELSVFEAAAMSKVLKWLMGQHPQANKAEAYEAAKIDLAGIWNNIALCHKIDDVIRAANIQVNRDGVAHGNRNAVNDNWNEAD